MARHQRFAEWITPISWTDAHEGHHSLAMFVLMTLGAREVLAAAGDARGAEPVSPLTWVFLLLPAAIVAALMYVALRRDKNRQTVIDAELRRSQDERDRNQAHREFVQGKLESLDQKLSRMVELLSAIERGGGRSGA